MPQSHWADYLVFPIHVSFFIPPCLCPHGALCLESPSLHLPRQSLDQSQVLSPASQVQSAASPGSICGPGPGRLEQTEDSWGCVRRTGQTTARVSPLGLLTFPPSASWLLWPQNTLIPPSSLRCDYSRNPVHRVQGSQR